MTALRLCIVLKQARVRDACDCPRRVSSAAGISLVELLATLAVLTILATILFFMYNQVVSTAGQAGCTSNLRSLGAAGLAYANDRSGLLPDGIWWRSERDSRQEYSLIPYIYGDNVNAGRSEVSPALCCPVALGHSEYRTQDNPVQEAGTYGINQGAHGTNVSESGMGDYRKWSQSNAIPRYLQRIERPEKMPFFLDGAGIVGSSGRRYSAFSNQSRASDRSQGPLDSSWTTPYLHRGETIAVVFMDGRVELVTHDTIVAKGEAGLSWRGN